MRSREWFQFREECSKTFPLVLEVIEVEVWEEMLAYAEENFGPDGFYARYLRYEPIDPGARWAWDGVRCFWFKSLADAAMFKLRWC